MLADTPNGGGEGSRFAASAVSWFKVVLNGINSTAIGLVGAACVILWEAAIGNSADAIVFCFSGVLAIIFNFPAPICILAGGVLGANSCKKRNIQIGSAGLDVELPRPGLKEVMVFLHKDDGGFRSTYTNTEKKALTQRCFESRLFFSWKSL
eukprot:scaffold1270_cov280-Chaetoceros_neogracile.AAC.3